jgi:hypothetical protein
MTTGIDRPRRHAAKAKPASSSAREKPAAVSASALALHLDLSRTRVQQLTADATFQRTAAGYPLDECRIRYIRALRTTRPRSQKSEIELEFLLAKTRKMTLEVAEKERSLAPVNDMLDMVDLMAGLFITHLGALPARVTQDLELRKKIRSVCTDIRREIANEAKRRAEEIETGTAAKSAKSDDEDDEETRRKIDA